MVLVPEVVDGVAPTPVLAAGGIGSGRQIAAALALGAQGVWLGSLWLTTAESDSRSGRAQRPYLGRDLGRVCVCGVMVVVWVCVCVCVCVMICGRLFRRVVLIDLFDLVCVCVRFGVCVCVCVCVCGFWFFFFFFFFGGVFDGRVL